jgi:hypothetical protein
VDDLVTRRLGVGFDGGALALVAVLICADVRAARGPEIGDGLPNFLAYGLSRGSVLRIVTRIG